MWVTKMRLRFFTATLFLLILAFASSAAFAVRPVEVLTLNGMIEPAVASYVENGIARAESDNASAVVIIMDTPGGMYDPMQDIVRAELASSVPVIVYVSPNGARAASAGTFITMAANVAAMAPVSRIGSAHPVFSGPTSGAADSTMMAKVLNDAVSNIETIAEKRGRNAKWGADAVRKSANIQADEAVKLHVVDFTASSLREVLQKADGMKTTTSTGMVVIRTKDAPIENYPMKWYSSFLQYLANPLIAYFLMLIAIYGIIFEINTPGATFPGVIGGIAILLLLYTFSVIPLNVAGLLLIILAIGLFIADIKLPSHGVLTFGGILAFFIGSMMVFGSGLPGMPGSGVPTPIIAAGTLATAVFFAFLVGWAVKALKNPVVTGRQALIGRVVDAKTDIAPIGKVFTEGAWWTAETEGQPINKGDMVKIVAMDGLKLRVVKEDIEKEGRS